MLNKIYCRDPYTGADWEPLPPPAPVQGVRKRRPPTVVERVVDDDQMSDTDAQPIADHLAEQQAE
jgi:hypothetical protein